MAYKTQSTIESGTEFMSGFDAAHDDAFFGVSKLPGGLERTALVEIGLVPCDTEHNYVPTEIEVMTGACEEGIINGLLNFERKYRGLLLFVDGYMAYKSIGEVDHE